jgi:hypothetical protein
VVEHHLRKRLPLGVAAQIRFEPEAAVDRTEKTQADSDETHLSITGMKALTV